MTRPPDQAARRVQSALKAGDARTAAAIARNALESRPNDTALRALLGAALIRLGDPLAALPHLEAAAPSMANDPGTLNALANAYRMLGRPDDALETAERALAAHPDSPTAVRIKSSVLRTTGRAAEALTLIESAARARPRGVALACEHADVLRALNRTEQALSALSPHSERDDLSDAHRRAVHIRRAQLLDQLDRFDDAFAAAARANAGVTDPPVTPAAPTIAAWPRDAIDRVPASTAEGVTPVLVVGMPRSGTTLLERIIAAHPSTAGVGECPVLPAILDELRALETQPTQAWSDAAGTRYLDALGAASPSATHAVDKMPANAFTLGLAERIAPNARVIHATRDPRDVCLSCYFQELNDSMAFTRDLAACARQHQQIDELMCHWRATVSLPWLAVAYEDLARDPETHIPRVLEFLGLPPDPACLAFHESTRHVETASWDQVKRPLYTTSIGKWRRYGKHLGPMLDVLNTS